MLRVRRSKIKPLVLQTNRNDSINTEIKFKKEVLKHIVF